jgi:hypothetical protein
LIWKVMVRLLMEKHLLSPRLKIMTALNYDTWFLVKGENIFYCSNYLVFNCLWNSGLGVFSNFSSGAFFFIHMQQDLCPTWSCDISFSLSRNIMENLKHYNAFWIGSHLYVAGWIHLPMWMELWVKTWDTVMCWVSFKFWIQFLFISAAKWRMIIILLQGLSKTWVTSANKQVYLIHVLVLDVFFNPNIW